MKKNKNKKKKYKRQQSAYYFGSSIEIDRVCTGNYGAKGKGRVKKKKATPEEVALQNLYNRKRKLRRIIKENYNENDYWTLLTYKKGYRTNVKDAKKDFAKFYRKLRREYKKRGYVLKWVVRTDVGKKGAAHHHFLANRIPDGDIIIKECWTSIAGAGFPSYKPIYEEGGFDGLAYYIVKPSDAEEEAYSGYSRSKNLTVPEPEISRTTKKEMQEYPKAPPGWYIDADSVTMGINRITGYEYQHFVMFKLDTKKQAREPAPGGKKGGREDG